MLPGAAGEGTGAAGDDEAVVGRDGGGVGDVALPAQHDAVAGSPGGTLVKTLVVRIAQHLPDEDGSGAACGEQQILVVGDGQRGDQALTCLEIVDRRILGVQVVRLDVAVARAEQEKLLNGALAGKVMLVKGD